MILADASDLLDRVNAPTFGGTQTKRAFEILHSAGLKLAAYMNTTLAEKQYQTIYRADRLALPAKEKSYLALSTEAGFISESVQPLAKMYQSFKLAIEDSGFTKGTDIENKLGIGSELGRILIYAMESNDQIIQLKYTAGLPFANEQTTGLPKATPDRVPGWLREAALQVATSMYMGVNADDSDDKCEAIPESARLLVDQYKRSNQDCFKPLV